MSVGTPGPGAPISCGEGKRRKKVALSGLQFQDDGGALGLEVYCGGVAVVVVEDGGAETEAEAGGFPCGLGGHKGVKSAFWMEEAWAGMGHLDLHAASFSGCLNADGFVFIRL